MTGRRQNAASPRQTLPIQLGALAKVHPKSYCFKLLFSGKIAAWI